MKLLITGLIGLALLAPRETWADGVIRLKTRTIDPSPAGGPARRGGGVNRAPRHFIVQFGSYPGPPVREELARRQIQVLAYVPDNSLMVSVDGPLNLMGLDVSWAGPLEAADKISPALATLPPGTYVVIFHSDADMSMARALVVSEGFQVLENPNLLPAQLLVAGPSSHLIELAANDGVAYILPASADLIIGNRVMGCAGPLTEAGPVAEYALVGNGWAPDPGGGVALRYFFDSTAPKLDANLVRGEIERAFLEWARYANISFTPADGEAAARSIDILFAAGAHGDAYAFDGPGGVLAHTFYPAPPNTETVAGDMHFDASENWNVGQDIDLFSVALHETGHALGLGHSDNPSAVMYPYYRMSAGLTADDINAVQSLYGPSGAAPPIPPTTHPAPSPTPSPAPSPTPSPSPGAAPPTLTIVSPGFTMVSTSSPAIAVSGTAASGTGVAIVKWTNTTGSSGVASGTTNWSASVPLLVGTNTVTIRAYDAAGNSSWRAITVERY